MFEIFYHNNRSTLYFVNLQDYLKTGYTPVPVCCSFRCKIFSIVHPRVSMEALYNPSRMDTRLDDVASPSPTATVGSNKVVARLYVN